jgi:uncharacterized protein YdeI (YjbR/CyaY-like superfamily)
MVTGEIRHFRAILEPAQNNLGWIIARVPFDIKTAWNKTVRLRVRAHLGGEVFRTSLFVDGTRGGHFLLVNKDMQRAAAAEVGNTIEVALEPDRDEREAVATSEFQAILKREKKLAKWYGEQSESMQREVGKWLAGVKSPEARRRRADQMAERMMLTIEAEKVLPPIIEVAFRRSPQAAKGWHMLTTTQRRSALLAVFYYQSPEARAKRVQKLVEECTKAASR